MKTFIVLKMGNKRRAKFPSYNKRSPVCIFNKKSGNTFSGKSDNKTIYQSCKQLNEFAKLYNTLRPYIGFNGLEDMLVKYLIHDFHNTSYYFYDVLSSDNSMLFKGNSFDKRNEVINAMKKEKKLLGIK